MTLREATGQVESPSTMHRGDGYITVAGAARVNNGSTSRLPGLSRGR